MGDTPQHTTRRRLLQTLGVGLAGGLAGCPASIGDDSTPTATPSETASPTATPTQTQTQTQTQTAPAIEQQILQRDAAAVSHVRTTVTATISVPRFNAISPLGQGVVGTWDNRNSDETLTLTRDRTFDSQGASTPAAGTYTIRPASIRLDFDNGGTATFDYVVDTDRSPAALRFFQQGEPFAVYDRVTGPGALDAVEFVETVEFYRLAGTDAGTVRQEVQTGVTGSGCTVAPTGQIVTSARAVLAGREPTRMSRRRLADRTTDYLQQGVRQNVAGTVTDAELRTIREAFATKLRAYYDAHASIDSVTQTVGVFAGTAGPDDEVEERYWPATVETAGGSGDDTGSNPTERADVAVVTVDESDLPAVQLGSSAELSTGDELFVVGYPPLGGSELFGDRTTALEPRLTSGVVSGRRALDSGVDAIRTDAAITTGNGGGPVYDGDGAVVGVAALDPATDDSQGSGLVLPVERVKSSLDRLGVEARSSSLERGVDSGLEVY
jgi:S1-C subfamily serine protease